MSYHTSEDAASRYPIGITDGYTVSELVETTRRLAADTVGASCGAAQLYLMDITEGADGTTEVCYGYSLSGAAVLLPEDGCAARFTVRNTACFFPSGRPPPRWRPCLPREGS